MFPYRDDNPTTLKPVMTVAIIGLNVLVWVLVQGMGSANLLASSICGLGLIPASLLGLVPVGTMAPLGPEMACEIGPAHWWTVLSSMFLHGGWLHLIGNMWFLWIFGNNIEDAMGHVRFLVFYLVCGVAAAAAQIGVQPHSTIPMVGASGAISGVLGGYLLLYPRVRVHTLVFLGFYVTTIQLPAYLMLGFWILLQLLGGLPSVGVQDGGVAYFAHIGGFVAGLVLVRLFTSPELLARRASAQPTFREW